MLNSGFPFSLSFLAIYQYTVTFSGLITNFGDYIVRLRIPEFGSKSDVIIRNGMEVSIPGYTFETELEAIVVADEARASSILNFFYVWEALKYSDPERTKLNYPSEYLKDVIINFFDRDQLTLKTYTIRCYPISVYIPEEFDYRSKEKLSVAAKLKIWKK